MPVSRKKKFRKNAARPALRKSGDNLEATILMKCERDGTFTITDKKTGKVLLSGFGAEKTARLLSDDIAECADEFFRRP